MRLLDVLNAPWAIIPERLLEIRDIYCTHLRGEKIDIRAIEARIGKPLVNERQPYMVQDGVAVIPVEGVIAKRMNLFTQISGGVSTQLLERDFREALADPLVHSIVLLVDSPGGAVDGTQEVARVIRHARGAKPLVALADGLIASAAYWIGSAADQVFISGDTTQVGSIGVVATHVDYSKADEMTGVKVSEITAGKYKRIASSHAPLSQEGRATIQDMVDHVYSVFVDEVAQNRSVSVEKVLSDMADGRLFLGQKAIDAGLVDGVSTLAGLIDRMNEENASRSVAGAVSPATQLKGDAMEQKQEAAVQTTTLTDQQIADLKRQAFEQGKAEGLTQGRAEGAEAERNRIRDVEAQLLQGHEKLIVELKYDGKTTGPEAAVKVNEAERKLRAQKVTDLKTDAPAPVPPSFSDESGTAKTTEPAPHEIADKAKAYQSEQRAKGRDVSASDAVAHVRKEMGLK